MTGINEAKLNEFMGRFVGDLGAVLRTPMSSRLFALPLVVLLAGCAGSQGNPVATGSTNAGTTDAPVAEPSIVVTEAMGSPHQGDAAPDFELPDQDGNNVRLSSMRGSIVVLAFVASFCPFSRAEQPHLRALAEHYRGTNVRVIAVGIDEPEESRKEYLSRMPMGMPVLRDDGGKVALRFTPPGAQPEFKDRTKALVTSNLVIDPAGKIRFFTVVDTVHFDAKLVHVRRAVERLRAESEGHG